MFQEHLSSSGENTRNGQLYKPYKLYKLFTLYDLRTPPSS